MSGDRGPGTAGPAGTGLWGPRRVRQLEMSLRLVQVVPIILGLFALIAAGRALGLAGDVATQLDAAVFFGALAVPLVVMPYLATTALRALPRADLTARRWAVFTGVLVVVTALFVSTSPIGIAGVGLGATVIVLATLPDDDRPSRAADGRPR